MNVNFEELKKECILKTQTLIKNHDWIKLQLILKDSPKQLIETSTLIEFELLELLEDKKSKFIGKNEKKKYSRPLNLVLELLIYKSNSLTRKFKNALNQAITPHSNKLDQDSNHLLVRALGSTVLECKEFSPHPKILKSLIMYIPESCIKFFPEIVKNRWYDLGFLFIQKYPPILTNFQKDSEIIFEKHNFNFYQYKSLRDILMKNYPDAVLIMDKIRKKRNTEFFNKLMISEKLNLDHNWFNLHQVDFSVGIDLYTDDELVQITSTIVSFGINNIYPEKESRWINLCLIEIGWAKKRYILEKFIAKLIEFNYYQVVGDYFKEKPEEIEKCKDLLLKEPSFVYSDLYQEYYRFFQIDDPVKIFTLWLKKGFNFSHLVNIFYQNEPELEKKFTEVLEKHYSLIDFSVSVDFNNSDYTSSRLNPIDLNQILFKVTNGNFPKYSVKFLQTKIKELLANPYSKPFFDPYLSKNFASKFNQLEEDTQNMIISLLIEMNKYHTLIRLIQMNYENFQKYLDQFLLIDPKESQYVKFFASLMQVIIRKELSNREIFNKIKNRLVKLEPIYETAQLLSYLGEHEQASEIYLELLKNEISLSTLIYVMVDYRLELLETKESILTLHEYQLLCDEAIRLLTEFSEYNHNKSRSSQFIFKNAYYQGRIFFSWAIKLINIRIYDSARYSLKEAYEFFSSLSVNKNLPKDVGNILEVYENITNILLQLFPVIEKHQDSDISVINKILSIELNSLVKSSNLDELRKEKITKELSRLVFNENGILSEFKGVIPAPFCPKPPIINRKYIVDENLDVIFEWDNENKPKLYYEPIKVSRIATKFTLFIEFVERINFSEYNLEIECPNFIRFHIFYPEFGNPDIKFQFFISSEAPFNGDIDIKLMIKPNDRCIAELSLPFPIKHAEMSIDVTPVKMDKLTILDYDFKNTHLGNALKEEFNRLGFYELNNPSSKNLQSWLNIIDFFFNLLNNSYDYPSLFRKKAKLWINEEKDMNPWIGEKLKEEFQVSHKDHSYVAGGDADHWVDEIPIEDKLLRTQESLGPADIIKKKFEKHKSQILLESGKSGFGVLVVADIRDEIIKGDIIPLPLHKCFKLVLENNIWVITFLIQAFQATPSKI